MDTAVKPVEKTGDGTATPRYTQGLETASHGLINPAGARAETDVKLST